MDVFDEDFGAGWGGVGAFLALNSLVVATGVIEDEESGRPEDCPGVEEADAVAYGDCWTTAFQDSDYGKVGDKGEDRVPSKVN